MRVKAAAFVFLVFGAFVAARLLLPDRALPLAQIETIHGVCPECHGEVPEYDSAAKPHRQHASFECIFCHKAQTAMKKADSFHQVLSRLSLGAFLLGLLGIAANFGIVRRKVRKA